MFWKQADLGKNDWWRYVVSLVLTLGAFIAGHLPFILTVNAAAAQAGVSPEKLDQLLADNNLSAIGISGNISLIVMLLPFAIALATLLICVRFIHQRPIRSALTSRTSFDWRRALFAGAVWFIVAGAVLAIFLPHNQVQYQFEFSRFLPLAVIALLLMPLQVAAEEVLFRGYMLQGVARFFARPIFPLLITTVLFAAAHLANPEFANGLLRVVPTYLMLSLFFGVLAVLDDGLELSIGAHGTNNLFSALILSTSDGAMNTASIFQTQVAVIVDHLPALILAIIISMGLFHLKYRFDWAKLIQQN